MIALIRIYIYGVGVIIAAMGGWELSKFLLNNFNDSPLAAIVGLSSLLLIPASSGLVIYLLSLIIEKKLKYIEEKKVTISFWKISFELGIINSILGIALLSMKMSIFEVNFILFTINLSYIFRALSKA